MRLSTPSLILFIAGCFLFSARPAAAQEYPQYLNVYSNTYISFDDEGGNIYGQADAYTDYAFDLYYEIDLTATLDGTNGTHAYGYNWAQGYGQYHPTAYVYLALEAEADTEYTITGDYTATAYFDTQYQYYDFSQYAFQNVYAYLWYVFSGYLNNSGNMSGGSSSHLGQAYDKKRVGKPDHVIVVDDNTIETDCGGKLRRIWYKAVDHNGRGVGTIKAKESFFRQADGIQLPFVYDSCEGGLNIYPDPSECERFTNGIIKDRLYVGCGGDCGVTAFLDRWTACTTTGPATLMTNVYSPRANEMLINGTASSLKGQHLY